LDAALAQLKANRGVLHGSAIRSAYTNYIL